MLHLSPTHLAGRDLPHERVKHIPSLRQADHFHLCAFLSLLATAASPAVATLPIELSLQLPACCLLPPPRLKLLPLLR
jgi:hypothetical protein